MGDLIIVEGELNGMACWLALEGAVAVIGMNGVNGSIWYEPLAHRSVYVLGDGDPAGRGAVERWTRTAYYCGAREVHQLDPWPEGDACDVAGTLGRPELRRRLE